MQEPARYKRESACYTDSRYIKYNHFAFVCFDVPLPCCQVGSNYQIEGKEAEKVNPAEVV